MDRDGGATELLVSRRRVLSTATYGLGAAVLFRPGLLDVHPPPDAMSPVGAPAGASVSNGQPPTTGESPPQRAVHRARLSSGGLPRAVCKGPAGVLVVGTGPEGAPISWLTEDGSQWVEQHLTNPAGGAPDVWGVAAHGQHFVAVGSTLEQVVEPVGMRRLEGMGRDGTYRERQRVPAVWWTKDCATWSGTPLRRLVDEHAQLIAVACNAERLVAVGSVLDADGVQGRGGLVVTSSDGRDWRPAALLDDGDGFVEGSFTGVAYDGQRWLATSSDIDGGMVWTSLDGDTWFPIAGSAEAFAGMTLQGISVREGRTYVAATSLRDATPGYFASPDGCATWRSVELDVELLSGPDASVQDIRVIVGDIVVVGTHNGVPVIEGGELDVRD